MLGLQVLEVAHRFYRYVDRAIYFAVDDSQASIAYSLATQGRYGFLSNPTIRGQLRTESQFNYGPWYFYLAAGLIWLFGYSLTLIRSIHLWTIAGSIVAAACWFRGRDRPIATALFGFAVLYCFEVSQWPMVRPDVLVSAFAIVLVICVGLAMMGSRPIFWFGAGIAASCGAFTHLIAVTLLPSTVLLYVASTWQDLHFGNDRRAAWRRAIVSAVWLGGGLTLGVAMFYSSFGFHVGNQARFLASHSAELAESPDSYRFALARHLSLAFDYLPGWGKSAVVATLGVGWLSVLAALRLRGEDRLRIVGYVLPPLLLWTAYTLSLGWYPNYHMGYAILTQMLFLWTGTALVWVALAFLREQRPAAASVATALITVLLIGGGGRQLGSIGDQTPRERRATTWIGFSDYSREVLASVPARATAWGSLIFGIEVPDRLQLISVGDALAMMPRIAVEERMALAPDYVVWGYPERREDTIAALRGRRTLFGTVTDLVPQLNLTLVSMVTAEPYGVTRVYARSPTDIAPTRLPVVRVYDYKHREWLSRVTEALPVVFTAMAPAGMKVGFQASPPENFATHTVAALLQPDRYLLRVSVKPGKGAAKRRLVTATSLAMHRQTIGELGPDGDFANYLERDTDVFLLNNHAGGRLYVSQFDDGADPSISSVTAYRLTGLIDRSELPNPYVPLPDLTGWVVTTGGRVESGPSGFTIEGDSSQFGYQVVSPWMHASPGDRVTVRVEMNVERGNVCPGILNGPSSTWLISPTAPRDELSFAVDQTSGFHVVLANCNQPSDREQSRFVVSEVAYAREPRELYVDRLTAAAFK